MNNGLDVVAATVNRRSGVWESIEVMATNHNLEAKNGGANQFDDKHFAERHDTYDNYIMK